ncbi:MAG: ethanolamine utilization microcompartment protein EutL [Deltaproteobacteria bacterium]|nr:ethanolamine utilization microcompartment protein EutL [Deltaproteobacteria bacterium]
MTTKGSLVALRPTLLACRQIDDVDPALAAAWFSTPGGSALGLVTCDQDDSTYIALDEATKHAAVDVAFARSFYAGSKHASGPYSGEILGVVRGGHPDDVEEALWVVKEQLRERVCFHTFAGPKEGPAFLAQVIAETGSYLSKEAGVDVGAPLAYLIAPPIEAAVAVDRALKAARVRLAKWIPPPSETNFAGAFLVGELAELEAARDAFVDAVYDVGTRPLLSARRPARLRR